MDDIDSVEYYLFAVVPDVGCCNNKHDAITRDEFSFSKLIDNWRGGEAAG